MSHTLPSVSVVHLPPAHDSDALTSLFYSCESSQTHSTYNLALTSDVDGCPWNHSASWQLNRRVGWGCGVGRSCVDQWDQELINSGLQRRVRSGILDSTYPKNGTKWWTRASVDMGFTANAAAEDFYRKWKKLLPFLITLNIHWKDWCWIWSSNTLATWCEEPTHWKRPWWWARLKAEGEIGDDRGWDAWMASLTQWTWVWASSGRWWRTGKPGVLQSMGSQRAGHDWSTAQQHTTSTPLKRIDFHPIRWSQVRLFLKHTLESGHLGHDTHKTGLPRWLGSKESACQCKRIRFDPWVGKIPWRRAWQPIPVFLPRESHDRGFWQATVHGVAKSQTRLSVQAHMHPPTCIRLINSRTFCAVRCKWYFMATHCTKFWNSFILLKIYLRILHGFCVSFSLKTTLICSNFSNSLPLSHPHLG